MQRIMDVIRHTLQIMEIGARGSGRTTRVLKEMPSGGVFVTHTTRMARHLSHEHEHKLMTSLESLSGKDTWERVNLIKRSYPKASVALDHMVVDRLLEEAIQEAVNKVDALVAQCRQVQ